MPSSLPNAWESRVRGANSSITETSFIHLETRSSPCVTFVRLLREEPVERRHHLIGGQFGGTAKVEFASMSVDRGPAQQKRRMK